MPRLHKASLTTLFTTLGFVSLSWAQTYRTAIISPVFDDSNPFGIDTRFMRPVINDLGQVAMNGYFSRSTNSGYGIYVWDQFGFRKVVETGDTFDRSIVTHVAAPTTYDPNCYFIAPSDVAFGVTIREAGTGTVFSGFYHGTGRPTALIGRLAKEPVGSYALASVDANEYGNWAAAFLRADNTTSVSYGALGGATFRSDGPFVFNYLGHGYRSNLFSKVRANLANGAFLQMGSSRTDHAGNNLSGILSFVAGSPPFMFAPRDFGDNFFAGRNLVGGVAASNGVYQMLTSNGAALSLRDNGSTNFEQTPQFRMNAIGQVANKVTDSAGLTAPHIVKSSSGGQGNLLNLGASNYYGGIGINPYGVIAATTADPTTGDKQLSVFGPFLARDGVSTDPPVLLQQYQPLFGDSLYDFTFDGIRQFNNRYEAVVRYLLTNGHTGIMKVQLDVPILYSYTTTQVTDFNGAGVSFTGSNINPWLDPDQTFVEERDALGHDSQVPTRGPDGVWVARFPYVLESMISSFQYRVGNARSGYTTPWITVTLTP